MKKLILISLLFFAACGPEPKDNPPLEYVCKECPDGLVCVDKNIFISKGLAPVDICLKTIVF